MCHCFFQYVFSLREMYILFPFQFVDFFHVRNLVYNSLEFIHAMLRLLFQTFIKFSSKVARNSSSWCSAQWDVLSHPLTTREIALDCNIDGYLASICNPKPFFPSCKCSLLRFSTPLPMVPCPDNPTCISRHSTLSLSRSPVS